MRTIKQKLRKISAWALAAALLGSSFDVSLPAEAAAAGENNNSAAILSFAEISDEIKTQTLEVGAQQSEIILPEELEVTVELPDAGNSGGESETDTSATEPETQPKTEPETQSEQTEPETASGQTEPQSDGQPTNQTPDEAGGEKQTDTGAITTETQGPVQDDTTEEVPTETVPEQAKTQEESQKPVANVQSQPETDPEITPEPEETIQEQSAGDMQNAAALEAAPAEEIPETEIAQAEVDGGILTSLLDAVFPSMTVHAAEINSQPVTLTDITWKIDETQSSGGTFQSETAATYVYVLELPETVTIDSTEYTLELGEGVELPEITVTIAWAADEYGTPVDGGTTGDCKWKVYDTDGDGTADLLVIGGGTYTTDYYYNESTSPWIQYYKTITNLVVENGVEKIGDCAFDSLEALKTASLPESVSEIGKAGFMGCGSLESIVIPDSVSWIWEDTFQQCYSLESVVLPEKLAYIGGRAFYDCGLTDIDLPETLTYIDWDVFNGCRLEKMIIPPKVTYIGDRAFVGTAPQNVYNLSGVTLTREMFERDGSTGTVYTVTLKGSGDAADKTQKILPSQVAAGTRYAGTEYDAASYFPKGDGKYWMVVDEASGSCTAVTAETEGTVLAGNPTLYYADFLYGENINVEVSLTGGDERYTLTVTDSSTGETLTEGTHYTHTITSVNGTDENGEVTSDGTKPGKVTVTITGIPESGYAGTREVSFLVSAAASVKLGEDGEETEYASLSAALASVGDGQTATVTLLENAVGNVTVSGNVTLTGRGDKEVEISGTVTVPSGASLALVSDTVTVSGTSAEIAYGVCVTGGTFVMEAGTVKAVTTGYSLAYGIEVISGTAEIKGGTITAGSTMQKFGGYAVHADPGSTLSVTAGNISSDGLGLFISSDNVSLSGGTISGEYAAVFIGTNSNSNTVGGTLEKGYVYYGSDGAYAAGVNSTDSSLPAGTYTIGKCTEHAGAWEPTADNDMHTRTCERCGEEETEAHTFDEDNRCEKCTVQAAASVTIDGEETAVYYTSIEKAWEAAQGKTAVITLLTNVGVSATLTVTSGSNITLKSETDGNGGTYTISGDVLNEDSGLINVAAGGNFTLDSGNINNGSGGTNAIAVSGGHFVMNGGSAVAQADGHSGICVYSGGTAEINGGSASGYNGLAIVNGGSGTVSGGTFRGIFDVSNDSAAILLRNVGSTTLKSILEPGMAYYSGTDVITENLITDLTGTRLYDTVTVGRCEHSYGAWTDDGDGKTHSRVCEVCDAKVSENHIWDENGKCTVDGCDAQGTIVASVTANGEMTWYTDIDEAWAAANAVDSAEVMLLTNVTCQSVLWVEAGSDITLAMQEGVVLSAEKVNYVISVSSSGSFTMKSGSIVTSGPYGIWVPDSGNFTLEDGSIAANGDDSYYGIYARGNVDLKGGNVSGTRDGVYIRISDGDTGSVTIGDTVISGRQYGVRVFSGSVSINGGEISGESAGIYVYEGTAYLNGGTIGGADNGVNIHGLGTVKIDGSTINGKTGVNNEGSLSVLSGTITGTEIGLSTEADNTQLSGGTFTGGTCSISCKDNVALAGLLAEYHDCYVGKDDTTVRIEDTVLSGTELSAADGYGTVTVARNLAYVALVEMGGSETLYSTGEEYETVLAALNAAWSAAAAAGENATVTLLQNINIGTDSLEVPSGSSITLKMADNIALSGSNNEKTGGIIKITGGSFVLAGGTVRNTITYGYGGQGFGIYVESGSLSVEGGEVVGNYAIYLPEGAGEDASVQISSGLIAGYGCGIGIYGGQVSVEGDAEIKATGNSWIVVGAFVQGGKLAVNGGLVSGNYIGIWNGGGNVTISGGTVTGGYGIYMAYGETEILGGIIRGTEYHGVYAERGTQEAVKLTIRGGEFDGAESGIYLYERSTEAEVQICIYGGTFYGKYGIYAGVGNKRVPELFGGTFTGSVCSVYLEDGTVVGDLPAEGYSLYTVAEDGAQTLIPEEAAAGSSLSAADGYGTVTVKRSNEDVISVEVSWGAMDFVYTDGAWNPDTHTYGEGGWTASEDGGDRIIVANKGETEVSVSYQYQQTRTDVSGSFTDGEGGAVEGPAALAAGDTKEMYLSLTGRPQTEEGFTGETLGTVTVIIGGE